MINKTLNFITALILLGVGTGVLGLGWLLWRFVEEVVGAIDRHFGDLFWLILGSVVIFAAVLVIMSLTFWLIGMLRNSLHRIWPKNGMLPAVEVGRGNWQSLNEKGAQSLGVIVASDKKQSAAMAGRVLREHYLHQYDQPSERPELQQQIIDVAPTSVTASEIVRSVDPRTSPHWLLVGSTGSGKTIASYAILDEMRKRYPCSFMIGEPGGVNWGSQALATRTDDISQMIIEAQLEMERRQEMLRSEDVDHINDLRNPPPYLILVTEEMDAVLDELKLTNLSQRQKTLVALRAIARMGRKPGVALVAVSQSGTTDVFDNHVRKNMGNVLLFRSEHTVNEMWRLQGIKLNELPPGAAYSVRHSAMVQFPRAQRPLLAAPNGNGQYQPEPVVPEPVYQTFTPDSAGIPVFSPEDQSEYTPEQKAHILDLYRRHRSLKAVQRTLYNQEGGYWFYRIQGVIQDAGIDTSNKPRRTVH